VSSDQFVFGGVKGIYAEDEEVSVSEAICLPLHGLDLVICAFQGAGGDSVVIVCEDSSPVSPKGVCEIFEYPNAGDLGPCDPVTQMGLGRSFVRERPKESEIFLHVVCRGQRLVEAQCLFEPRAFVSFIVEVFGILQEEPAGPFQDVLVKEVRSFPVEISTQFGQFLVEQLDQVEMVENDGRVGQIGSHCGNVCLRHIHGNGPDSCSRGFQTFPEGLQCVGSFAFAYEHDCPGVQVENYRQVVMSVTDADLIDGNPFEPLEGRLEEMSAEVRLLDLLDRMPIDPQMASDIRHGHVFREFQDIPLKALGVSPVRVGKLDLYLPSHPTGQAVYPLNGKLDNGRSKTNGKRYEPAKHGSLPLHLPAPTKGTLKGRGVFSDSENRFSLLETTMDMMDAASGDPKTVIQYARGHAFSAFSDSLKNPRKQNACPFSLFKSGTHLREDPQNS